MVTVVAGVTSPWSGTRQRLQQRRLPGVGPRVHDPRHVAQLLDGTPRVARDAELDSLADDEVGRRRAAPAGLLVVGRREAVAGQDRDQAGRREVHDAPAVVARVGPERDPEGDDDGVGLPDAAGRRDRPLQRLAGCRRQARGIEGDGARRDDQHRARAGLQRAPMPPARASGRRHTASPARRRARGARPPARGSPSHGRRARGRPSPGRRSRAPGPRWWSSAGWRPPRRPSRQRPARRATRRRSRGAPSGRRHPRRLPDRSGSRGRGGARGPRARSCSRERARISSPPASAARAREIRSGTDRSGCAAAATTSGSTASPSPASPASARILRSRAWPASYATPRSDSAVRPASRRGSPASAASAVTSRSEPP